MTKTLTLKRKDAPKESTWNKEVVYPTWEGWQADMETALAELPELNKFDGKLKDGPGVLADWFEVRGRHWRRMMILWDYAAMAMTVDTGDVEAKGFYSQAVGLSSKFKAATAYAGPQMLKIGKVLLDWVEQEPRLAAYKHFFHNLLRLKAHHRSEEVEEILGIMEEPFDSVYQAATELADSDLRFAEAVDSQGKTHLVNQASIDIALQDPDRERRRTTWESYFDGYLSMENTLATIYLTNVKQWILKARVRGYGSVLEMMLSPTNLPLEIFNNLIDNFKKNLPVWHRYWDVKARVLGVETMRPWDVWAPIMKNPPVIPYKQSVDWISDALKPMGDEYVSVLRRGAFEDRWVDWAPNLEKRQNAASSLQVDNKPPYIYMSYDDSIMSLGTLAHELGHSMHSYYTALNQPDVYNDYGAMSSTLAETASNFHQAMVRAYLRNTKADDRNLQLSLIDEAMANFHRYFFIMPTLALFEYEVFAKAEAGKPLTAKDLNNIMLDLYAEGYGETMEDDLERTGITWAQFLHLYSPFYTFQYAIGISAAHYLADDILSGSPGADEQYLEFLKAGGSLYTMDLFKLAGVDMSSPEPVNKAFKELADMVDQLEELAA